MPLVIMGGTAFQPNLNSVLALVVGFFKRSDSLHVLASHLKFVPWLLLSDSPPALEQGGSTP